MDLTYDRIIDNCIKNADPREIRRLAPQIKRIGEMTEDELNALNRDVTFKKLMSKIVKQTLKVCRMRDMAEVEKRSFLIPI